MSRKPDFDIDLRVGEAAEDLVLAMITDATLQVKHDRLAMKTGRLYVETECYRQGRWMPKRLARVLAAVDQAIDHATRKEGDE